MSAEDRDYYRNRAETELARAEAASHPEAVRAHALLAGFYFDLVHNGGERSMHRAGGR